MNKNEKRNYMFKFSRNNISYLMQERTYNNLPWDKLHKLKFRQKYAFLYQHQKEELKAIEKFFIDSFFKGENKKYKTKKKKRLSFYELFFAKYDDLYEINPYNDKNKTSLLTGIKECYKQCIERNTITKEDVKKYEKAGIKYAQEYDLFCRKINKSESESENESHFIDLFVNKATPSEESENQSSLNR